MLCSTSTHMAQRLAFVIAVGALLLAQFGLAAESRVLSSNDAAIIAETTPFRLAQLPAEVPGAEEEVEEPPDLDPLAELEALLEQPVLVNEPVATTLSRVEEKISEAPGTVYVFPRDVIFKRGYRSLGELLRTVPGFTVFHRDLQFVVGVRGFQANDNDKVTLLINSQRVLGMHEQEFLNGPINLDNVERVEVVVGPSSLFQQAYTLAATINVITRNIDGIEAIAATGNAQRYSATVMAGRRWADDNYLSFSFTTEEKRGFDAWDPNFRPNLAGRDLTGELNQPNYFSILRWQNGGLAVQAIAYRTTWPELLITNGDAANDGEFKEEYYSLFVDYEHEFDCALTGIAKFQAERKETVRQNQTGRPNNAAEQILNQRTYRGELGLRDQGFHRHLIQTGMQVEYDDNFDTYFTYTELGAAPPIAIPPTTMVSRDTYALGFYLDDQIDVSDRLKLIAGVRADKNTRLPDSNDWFPGARAAVVYDTTPNWITKVTYNRSVRMPSALTALNEVWGSNNPPGLPQPAWAALSPTARAPEILSTIELHNVFYLDDVRIGTIYYYESLADFLTWFQPHSNGGNFRGNGIELTLDAEVNPCFNVWANCAWNATRLSLFRDDLFGPNVPPGLNPEEHHAYIDPNGRLIGSPEWTANLGFDWDITDCLTFSPAVRYFTEQAALDRVSPTADRFVKIRNQFYFDAALTWYNVWHRDMDIRLSGRNLLNNRDLVGGQLVADLYRPRGTEVVLTLDARF